MKQPPTPPFLPWREETAMEPEGGAKATDASPHELKRERLAAG